MAPRDRARLCGLGLIVAATCFPAAAEEAKVDFDIPLQPLGMALQSFARQAGYRILYPSEPIVGLRTQAPIVGRLAPALALRRLLAGSPLIVVSFRGQTVVLSVRQRPTRKSAERRTSLRPPAPKPSAPPAEIVVLGSQIRSHSVAGLSPAITLGRDVIDATGAPGARDLFRAIPQALGDSFNESNMGNANYAHGDISSVTLHGLGQGNTLLLLNGRRLNLHPMTQLDNQVPIFGYNVNIVPVAALDSIEILKEGAAALYGSDAVAGVIDLRTKPNADGAEIGIQHGSAEGLGMYETQITGWLGRRFAQGRGIMTAHVVFSDRSILPVSRLALTRNANRLPLVTGTSFEGSAAFDQRSIYAPWAAFRVENGRQVAANGSALTDVDGQFHVQPASRAGCRAVLTGGPCLDDGLLFERDDQDLRFDAPASFPDMSILPSVKRWNMLATSQFDISDRLQAFGEVSFYRASSIGFAGPSPMLSSTPITVAANAYWNPFGPVGSRNRLPGLDIPDEGVPVTLVRYSPADAGSRRVDVLNYQYRLLAGLRGKAAGWSWESAGLYTWATVKDTIDAVSSSGLQAAINRTTPDAYNPFSGGDPANPSIGDATPSNAATIDSFRFRATRGSRTSLAMWDLKLSKADALAVRAGGIGIAAGIELRKESFRDRRDPHQSGEIAYVDSVTGINYGSDFLGQSTRKDVDGKRTVFSAYAEAAVPLVSPDMNIPLVRQIDVQLASRYERYSDVGSVAKPKIAGFWDVFNGVRLRASWSGGFRAPNLEVLNTPVSEGVTAGTDYVLCEADLRAGRIASFSACSRSQSIQRRIDGNPELKPETSTSFSYGMVLEPNFLPSRLGKLTFTVDRWRIRQKGVVGVVDYTNAVALDYLLRTQGSFNPAVVRRDPTADDAALVAGTGLAPAGEILYVQMQYLNLQPVEVEGIDLGLRYHLPNLGGGSLSVDLNAAHLLLYFQSPSALERQLLEAQGRGSINSGLSIGNAANLRGVNARPEWKFALSATYENGPVQIGLSTQYIDSVDEAGVFNMNDDIWSVESQITTNLNAQYRFDHGPLDGVALRLGVRNLTDEKPPLASVGYLSALYSPVARYWYAGVSRKF